jgi:hypothetical protein
MNHTPVETIGKQIMDWRMMSIAQTTAPKEVPVTTAKAAKKPNQTKAPAGRARAGRSRRALELKSAEEDKATGRFVRLSSQNRGVLFTLLTLATLQAVSTFTTSYAGMFGAAEWAFGVNPLLQSLAPLAYDVAIVSFTIKLFMDREEGEPVVWNWIWIGVLALISAGANVIHTLTVSTAETVQQLVIGGIIAGASPFLLALTIEVAASKVFKKIEVKA